jgi:zinc transport system substrate-binding protein
MKKRFFFWGVFTLFLLMLRMPAFAALYLASIPPLHSLLSGLLKDVAVVDVLLEGQFSPHTYTLKPSDIAKIRHAEVIFWIGPGFEFFLVKPIQVFRKKNIQMIELPTLMKHPQRSHHHWQPSQEMVTEHSHRDSPSTQGSIDPHLWLDPQNALHIVQFLKSYLIQHHPAAQDKIDANYVRVEKALRQLQADLYAKLKPLRGQSFFVFHDGYQYIEKAFHLNGAGVMMINPETSPSVRHMNRLAAYARQKHVRCVFAESQFSPTMVAEFARLYHLKVATLDPLGQSRFHDERDYIATLNTLADTFVTCLKKDK